MSSTTKILALKIHPIPKGIELFESDLDTEEKVIEDSEYAIQTVKHNKARRTFQKYPNELMQEKEKRAIQISKAE